MTAGRTAGGGDPGAGADGREALRRKVQEDEGEPCLRCGVPLSRRLMGCKGGHCPNCGHPYPHGDCSD